MLGIGRGLGRVEFDGFRVEMGKSRRLFAEYAEAILNGLESGVIEADGELYKQPAMTCAPRRMRRSAVAPSHRRCLRNQSTSWQVCRSG